MVVYMRVCVYDRSFLFWVESNLMWISEFWHRHFFFYSTWILLVSCFLFIHVTVMTLGLIWSGNWISGVAFRWNTLGVDGKLIFHCLGLGVSLLRVVFVMVDLFFLFLFVSLSKWPCCFPYRIQNEIDVKSQCEFQYCFPNRTGWWCAVGFLWVRIRDRKNGRVGMIGLDHSSRF
jgi:hypothetical protein